MIRNKIYGNNREILWYIGNYSSLNYSVNFYIIFFRDLDKLQNGIGEKVGIFVYLITSFIFSIIISFIYGWELTLVMSSCTPVIIIATAIVAKVIILLLYKKSIIKKRLSDIFPIKLGIKCVRGWLGWRLAGVCYLWSETLWF